jgi:hypothetical protein
MTVNPAIATEEQKPAPSDKELNFRKQEEMFNRKLEQERLARQQAEERLSQLERMVQGKVKSEEEDEELTDEPYVDHKRLQKAQARMEKKIVGETDSRIQQEVRKAIAEERKAQWMKQNTDFFEVMDHAQAFADRDPELAETILAMPEGFERQKLVYKSIKALGLHKKEEPKPSMQQQIDSNRRNMFYSPSGMSPPAFEQKGDFSEQGQKNAFSKMKQAQKRIGIFN